MENLSVTDDYFDGIDLSYNKIAVLREDSILKNLRILIVNHNKVEKIEDISFNFPKLEDLSLRGN